MPARPVTPSPYALVQKRFKAAAIDADLFGVLSRSVVSALLCSIVLAIPSQAGAATLLPPKGKVFTGVAMGTDLGDFTHRIGHRPAVWEQFVAWNRNYRWA